MKFTTSISAVLDRKGSTVWTIEPDTMVIDAIRLMAEQNVGALPVVENGRIIGMFSERDYTRKVVLRGRSSRETSVHEIMTSPPVTLQPGDSVDRCMRIMTEQRIRHIPIASEGEVLGIISIGDVVNWIISAQSATIEQLEKFITGEYPA